jgi:thiamine biosynthesis lipoprotein
MKETRVMMGMPITVEILDEQVLSQDFEDIYAYFAHVDEKFSTYKQSSEISQINREEIAPHQYSSEIRLIFALSEKTKRETDGYFDIKKPDGTIDPSGLVKGWAILNAAEILHKKGLKYFYIDAGGDIQPSGSNAEGKAWRVGIKNPFNEKEVIKIVYVHDKGVATSGTYIRGQHIYDPHTKQQPKGFVSLTVIGPDVFEADRFATAAFAMGKQGINFIEELKGFEGYGVDTDGIATVTSGFLSYTVEA